ncbi:NADH-quinone oxidoreductase subunit H [bacterium]|nr:NADH-quinone oxidoreductase subunit H [bacterium]
MPQDILLILVRGVILVVVCLTAFAYLTYLERRVLSWFQWRVGPNRVGPWGLFQPIADGVKAILKQELIPRRADKVLYLIAPIISFSAAFTMFSLIPVGERVFLTDLPIAVLVFLGLSSLAAYGVILAGWSSQNRYSFMGALRSIAQVISYELGLGLALMVPVMIVGSLKITDIGNIYRAETWHPAYLFVLLPAGVLFLVSAMAETARIPFDLPECESELVTGFHTEYSSLKYAMFPMGEYMGMSAMCAIAVHFFLGGYLLPAIGGVDLTNWVGLIVGNPDAVWGPQEGYWTVVSLSALGLSTTLTFVAKTLFLILIFMWIRATEPRFRYDQLMQFGWKVLLPAGLVLVFLAALFVVLMPDLGGGAQSTMEVSMYVPR